MYNIYILLLKNKTHYIGYSDNLKLRVNDHNKNKIVHTKNLNPKLIFYASFSSKLKALHFEKYLKTPSGFAFRNKRLIKNCILIKFKVM